MAITDEARERIILAADVSSLPELFSVCDELKNKVGMIKIGLEAITSIGADRCAQMASLPIFYDGKFCDIPNTVGKASKACADMGVTMFNVHATAGAEAMKAAVAYKGSSLVLAVTVLTSIGEDECYEIFGQSPNAMVSELAEAAYDAGCDGVICSAADLPALVYLKERAGEDGREFLFVAPGIRPAWSAANDQKRITTPKDAILAGADYLVIGRAITNPPDGMSPFDAANKVAEEIAEALKELEDNDGRP